MQKTGTILLFCTSRRDTGTDLIKPEQIPENRDVWSPYSRMFGQKTVGQRKVGQRTVGQGDG